MQIINEIRLERTRSKPNGWHRRQPHPTIPQGRSVVVVVGGVIFCGAMLALLLGGCGGTSQSGLSDEDMVRSVPPIENGANLTTEAQQAMDNGEQFGQNNPGMAESLKLDPQPAPVVGVGPAHLAQ